MSSFWCFYLADTESDALYGAVPGCETLIKEPRNQNETNGHLLWLLESYPYSGSNNYRFINYQTGRALSYDDVMLFQADANGPGPFVFANDVDLRKNRLASDPSYPIFNHVSLCKADCEF